MKKYIVISCDGSIVVTKARFGNYLDAYGRPRCINLSLSGSFFGDAEAEPARFKKYVRADVTREAAEDLFRKSFPRNRYSFQVKTQVYSRPDNNLDKIPNTYCREGLRPLPDSTKVL